MDGHARDLNGHYNTEFINYAVILTSNKIDSSSAWRKLQSLSLIQHEALDASLVHINL